MSDVDRAITEVTENVWRSILGLEIQAARDTSFLTRAGKEPTLTGCVQLTGAWEGTVFLYSTAKLARELAAIMFGTDVAHVASEDVEDALGEIANMIAGNLKSLLPRPCQLSLPAVVEGLDYRVIIPGARIVGQFLADCEAEPVLVTLMEGNGTSRLDAAGVASHRS
jgi:chemotaxis protein CheX